MDDKSYITLTDIESELRARRVEADKNRATVDRDAYIGWAHANHGEWGSRAALLIFSLSAGTQNNFYGGTFMSDMGNTNISGQMINSAVGQGNKVKAGDIAVSATNTAPTFSLSEGHANFLEAIASMNEWKVSEKAETKNQADSIKAELEKPEGDRDRGFIARTYKKLCAIAPDAAGRFLGGFTAAYLDQN